MNINGIQMIKVNVKRNCMKIKGFVLGNGAYIDCNHCRVYKYEDGVLVQVEHNRPDDHGHKLFVSGIETIIYHEQDLMITVHSRRRHPTADWIYVYNDDDNIDTDRVLTNYKVYYSLREF